MGRSGWALQDCRADLFGGPVYGVDFGNAVWTYWGDLGGRDEAGVALHV